MDTVNSLLTSGTPDNICYYAIWAAILPPDRLLDRAANLSVFIEESINPEDFSQFTEENVNIMAYKAYERLIEDPEMCKGYNGISRFKSLLLPGTGKFLFTEAEQTM